MPESSKKIIANGEGSNVELKKVLQSDPEKANACVEAIIEDIRNGCYLSGNKTRIILASPQVAENIKKEIREYAQRVEHTLGQFL